MNPFIRVTADSSQARREIDSLSSSFSRLGAQVRSIASMFSQAVTGLRQMAQGFQNLGFVLTAFVSFPFTRFMSGAVESITSFEEKMVEVAKTTALPSSAINKLGSDIRDLSKATPTAQSDLAGLAAEAGRLGVAVGKSADEAIRDINEFVRVADMMGIATILSGEEAAHAFGKLIAVLKDIDVTNIENLGSSINELGQATASNEQEIVGAMMRIAPAAASLNIAGADVAAFAAMIVQLSESAARAGTKGRVALENLGLNFEKAAALIGVSAAEMKRMIEEDAVAAFLMIVDAAANAEDSLGAMESLFQVFGTTGANAVQRFAANFEGFTELIDLSRKAFEEGTSLQNEFNRAMQATNNVFDVVKNNIREVGMEFMNSLLPIAKEFMTVLIPAIQDLGKVIEDMSDKQKLMIVAFGAFISIGLPVISLIASFGFALTMVVNGIVNLLGGTTALIVNLITLGTGTKFATAAMVGFVTILAGALVVGITKATGAFDVMIEKIESIASQAAAWADKIIGDFAGNLIRAASTYLIAAMNYIGNIVASFLEPHSPPEKGPLSSINQWGKRLIDIYLQGFMKGDFSLLDKLSGVISHVFKNMADLNKISKGAMVEGISKGRELVAKLLDTFNKTGIISESVLTEISNLLGEAGDETVKLLKLQLRYNKSLRDLEAIRQKEKDVDETYQAEIRSIMRRTDLTEVEKMRAIRAAKSRKSLALDNLSTEKKVAQENVDSIKDQIDWQEEYIGALQETDNIFAQLIETAKKTASSVGKAIKGIVDKLDESLEKLLEELRVNQEMQKIYKKNGMDTQGLLREELNLRQRIVDVLIKKQATSAGLSAEEQKSLQENISRIQELQKLLGIGVEKPLGISQIGDAADGLGKAQEGLRKTAEEVQKFADVLDDGRKKWDLFMKALRGEALPEEYALPDMKGMEPREIAAIMQTRAADPFIKWYDMGKKVKGVLDEVKGRIDEVKNAVQRFKDMISNAATSIKKGFNNAVSGMSDNSNEALSTIKRLLPIIISVIAGFKLFKLAIGAVSKILGIGFIGSILGMGTATGVFSMIWEQVQKLKYNIIDLAGVSASIGRRFSQVITIFMAKPLLKMVSIFENAWFKMSVKGVGAISSIGRAIAGTAGSIKGIGIVMKKYPKVFAAWTADLGGRIKTLGGLIPSVKNAFIAWFTVIRKHPKVFLEYLATFPKRLGAALLSLPKMMLSTGKTMALSLITGIISNIKSLPSLIAGSLKSLPGLFKGGIIKAISGGFKAISLFKTLGIGIISLVSSLASGIASVTSFVAMITGIGGAAVALAGIIAGVVAYIIKNWDKFKDKVSGAVSMVISAFKAFVTQFKKALGIGSASLGDFKSMLGLLYMKAEPILKFISGALVEGFRAVAKVIAIVLPQIGAFIGSFVRGVGAVALGIIDTLSGLIRFVEGVINAFKNADWKAIFEDLKNLKIGDALKKLFGGEVIKNALKQFGTGIATVLGGLLHPIIGLFKGVFNIIYNLVWTIINKLRSKLGNVKLFNFLLIGLDKVRDFFTGIYDILLGKNGGVKGLVQKAVYWFEFMRQKIAAALSGAKEVVGGAIDKIANVFNKIKSAISGGPAKAGNFLSDMGEKIKNFLGYAKMAYEFVKNKFKQGFVAGLSAIYQVLGPLGTFFAPLLEIFARAYQFAKPFFFLISKGFKAGGIKGVIDLIRKNLPVLVPLFAKFLGSIMTLVPKMLGNMIGLITQVVLPAIGNFISGADEYLAANVPKWANSIGQALAQIGLAIWAWVSEVGLPWIAGFIDSVSEWIITNAPIWWESFKEALGNISNGLWVWITEKVVPWIAKVISSIIGFIRTEGPGILAGLLEVLSNGMTALASWIVNDVTPWVMNFIGAIIKWIWDNGPGIIESILLLLADLIKFMVTWIYDDALPWVAEWIQKIWEYLEQHGPKWFAAIKALLGRIAVEMLRWVLEDALPTIVRLIGDGLEELEKIGGEWFDKIKEGLTKIYNKFKEIFDDIETYITSSIKGAINTVIGTVESGINKIIEGVNSLIRKVNAVASALGFGDNLLEEIYPVTFPRLARGGIALSEQLAIVGDVPEAIIPLSKLGSIMGDAFGGKDEGPRQEINIIIKDNVVRDDRDIDRLATQVSYRLGLKLSSSARALGGIG